MVELGSRIKKINLLRIERLMQVIGTRLQSLATLYSDNYYQGSTEQSNSF